MSNCIEINNISYKYNKGRTVFKDSLGKTGEMIGYVYQYSERQLFATSVIEELTFPLIFKGKKRKETYEQAEEMIKIFDLEKVKDSYPFFLSYGEKRRLAIASVLMNKPKYLILDEPTSSLDTERIEALSCVLDELKNESLFSNRNIKDRQNYNYRKNSERTY